MKTGTVTDVRRTIQERGAIWAYQQFQLVHPELTSYLHGANCEYAIHIIEPVDDWVELCRQFDSEIRPVTANVRLVRDPPSSKRVIPASSAFDEAWMLNEPMPQLWVDDLLCLAAPELPEGSLTFQFDPEGYVFQHPGLTEADVERVDAAFRALKLPGTLRFAQLPAKGTTTHRTRIKFLIAHNVYYVKLQWRGSLPLSQAFGFVTKRRSSRHSLI